MTCLIGSVESSYSADSHVEWRIDKSRRVWAYYMTKKREHEAAIVACRLLGHVVHWFPTKSGYNTWIGLCARCRAMPPNYVHGDKPQDDEGDV
jgi:hypothetical protein